MEETSHKSVSPSIRGTMASSCEGEQYLPRLPQPAPSFPACPELPVLPWLIAGPADSARHLLSAAFEDCITASAIIESAVQLLRTCLSSMPLGKPVGLLWDGTGCCASPSPWDEGMAAIWCTLNATQSLLWGVCFPPLGR